MPYIILILCLALSLVLHFMTDGFPVMFFTFPLNLILALIWSGGMIWLWKSRRKSLFVDFMLSKGATISAVTLFLVYCIIIGITGRRELASSWISVVILLYLQTVLLFVILRGWRMASATRARIGDIRWRFLLNHAGLLIAVSSAFWGTPDSQTMRLQAVNGIPVKEAYRMDGSRVWLPYDIILNDFRIDTYDNGVPSMYEADMVIDGNEVTLRVNEPYSYSLGEDIYLTGYETNSGSESRYCIIQIVHEPWKYFALTGIIMMLSGALLLFINGPKRRLGEND